MMPNFLQFIVGIANQRGHDYKKAKEDSLVKIEQAKTERQERKVKQAEIDEKDRILKAEAEAKAKIAHEEREKERAATAEMSAKQAQREAEAMAKRENRKFAERPDQRADPWRRAGPGAGAGPDAPLPVGVVSASTGPPV
ncbi:hypothetical protein KEM48_013040 [Puccinia striiformis f. sp. tritici PST-130]|nr:hypothetical protein KEM48_013040 [Puccinia striiformis f. sp. tritici PST-130]